MTGAGILDGDALVVDWSRTSRHGNIVLAVIDNEITVKELDCQGPAPCLRAHHPERCQPVTPPPAEAGTTRHKAPARTAA